MANSGCEVPYAALTGTTHGVLTRGATAADLALAMNALAAAGAFDPHAMNTVACIGELGLDGRVRPVDDVNEAVRIAYASGYRTVVVDEDLSNIDVAGIGIHNVKNLRQALALMERFGQAKYPPGQAGRENKQSSSLSYPPFCRPLVPRPARGTRGRSMPHPGPGPYSAGARGKPPSLPSLCD